MEVREAPDGEEGLDLPQSQNLQASISLNEHNMNSMLVTAQLDENSLEEAIRVPDWISRPKTAALSVVFNENSLHEIHKIVGDKAEEKQ